MNTSALSEAGAVFPWQRAGRTGGGAALTGAERGHCQSRGCLSCAVAQTKIPFFLCLVSSPSVRRTLSYKQESNLCNCSVTDKTWILYQSVRELWPLAFVNRLRRFLISSSFYGFNRNSVGKFILGVFLIYLKQESRLGNLEPKLLWMEWLLSLNQNYFRLWFASHLNLEQLSWGISFTSFQQRGEQNFCSKQLPFLTKVKHLSKRPVNERVLLSSSTVPLFLSSPSQIIVTTILSKVRFRWGME